MPTTLDDATFEALYLRLERSLYNAAFRYVWQEEDAHDVVQDAFVKLWDARARVRSEGAEAYLWRTALNTASNKRRWSRLRAFVRLDDALASRVRPDDAVAQKLEDAGVRRAVDALPEDLRRVLLLSEVASMKHADIAALLGVAEGTVASRRSRAFEKLRDSLGREEVPHAAVR